MSNQRDSHLQALFAETNQSLVEDSFTKKVMLLTRKRRMQWYLAGTIVVAVTVVIASQFRQPLQSIALILADVLSIELIDLGDTAAAWFLSPANNLATALVVIAKGLRMSWKKARRASFAN
jgi:hypothetical protein